MSWTLMSRRSAAYVVDVALLFAVLGPMAFLVRGVVGVQPVTGLEIWVATLTSFSIPLWLYSALCDASRSGATVGKRVAGVAVTSINGSGRVTLPRAAVRTAVKLVPWELAHVVGFALADVIGPAVQTTGVVAAKPLAAVWVGSAVLSDDSRSVHDLTAGTVVQIRTVRASVTPGG